MKTLNLFLLLYELENFSLGGSFPLPSAFLISVCVC